jgi:hypothetical protein
MAMNNMTLIDYVEEFRCHVIEGMSRNDYDVWVQNILPRIRALGDDQAQALLRDIDICGYYLRIMPKQVQTLVLPFIDRLIDHLKSHNATSNA